MSQSKYQCLKSIVVTMVCNNHNIFGERSYFFFDITIVNLHLHTTEYCNLAEIHDSSKFM